MSFKEVDIYELTMNPFKKLGKEWLLITAGNGENHNTMTASWGGLGVFWGKNTATVYIRQSRYTKEFVDQQDTFTISFYDETYKKALAICGSKSGRDSDKEKEAGLTPYFVDNTTAFHEANMIMVCKKVYEDFMPSENFIEKENDEKWYGDKDYHTMYIAEILKVYIKE